MVFARIVIDGVQDLALVLILPRDIREVRVVASKPDREHEVLDVEDTRRAIPALNGHVPLVVRVLNCLRHGRLCPDVQLKRLSVVLEPPGEFLRGSVYRPRRREPALASTRPRGHNEIDGTHGRYGRWSIPASLRSETSILDDGPYELTDWIVQAQRLVPVPPLVANALVLLHDQRWYAEMLQPSGDIQTTLSASYDENRRIRVHELLLALALCKPLPMVRERISVGPDLLREALELLEIRVEREAGPLAIRSGHETEETTVHAMFSLEGVLAEDPRQIGVWVLKLGVYQLEPGRTGSGKRILQELANLGHAMESTERPSQREHVAPPGVGRKEREDTIDVLGFDISYKRVEPK